MREENNINSFKDIFFDIFGNIFCFCIFLFISSCSEKKYLLLSMDIIIVPH
ncbi:hypothetical protein GJA_4268 [Janthinobacterium agaricidamnosum NBRC 102515 = DSM 9628]|uniref:Lipoprotein n=1 Tax=Janthinobacterium agaricidamnosum NBRC 102515 = DSM 9628 TaxID=1349767 RepID=W0VAG8_9BURK|nr:hypothetical protein GJA_4268 [Janthinobacterium agaricidamnosum NBRC 102515 = DSM 9628]